MLTLLIPLGILFLQLCLIVGIVAFVMRGVAQIYSRYIDVPFVPTPVHVFTLIVSSLEIRPGDVVYELGSGDGRFLLYCAKKQPSARYVGIERNPLLIAMSRLRAYLSGNPRNVVFRRENFYATPLTEATKIYGYLLNSVMNKLLPKLESEFHGRMASRAFTFREKSPSETIVLSEKKGSHGEHMLYLYEF